MNFSIEVSGAALPLTLVELVRVLQAACSAQDHHKRQAADQQLSSWQGYTDFYPTLQAVFLDTSLPREIRFLSIIQLKNGIDNCWRIHTTKNAIQPAEKRLIRSNLFRGSIEERDPQLALHNALVVAKIVRVDFPEEWPNALDDLIAQLGPLQHDEQRLAGALLILLRIVKELGTARLLKSQKALQAVAPRLVRLLGEIYDAKTRFWLAFLTSGQGDENSAVAAMGNSLMAFRILRRLLIIGYEFPHRDESVRRIWGFSQSQFGQLLNTVDDKYPALGKHILQFTKLHVDMASSNPASFAALPNSPELAHAYWNLVAEFSLVFDQSKGIRQGSSSRETKLRVEGPLLERLALKGLLLMRACVRMVHSPVQSIKYRSKADNQENKEAIAAIKSQLFSDDFVNQMTNVIITRLLVFRQADMEAWEEEPQEWEQREESQGNAYEWEVRPCAERLFLDLLTYNQNLLLQPLLAYFATAHDPQASVAAKEAIYTALGLAAALVHRSFDFDALLKSVIAADAVQTAPMCQVLRRRIAILLSQWVPVEISRETRPLIYEIFRHFLKSDDPCNDIVVRITAARQFKAVVDDFGFDEVSFRSQAPDVLKELIHLIQFVEVDETKLAIIETLRSLISRMDTSVIEFSDLVMDALPGIWSSAGDLGFMMKQAVLSILLSLVVAMRADSQRYHHLVFPLIAEATQKGSDTYIYLIDEALDLWLQVLQHSQPPLSSGLLNLASIAIQQLSEENDHAETCISIVGAYLLLAPQTLLEDNYRQPLLRSLLASLGIKGRDQMNSVTRYIEMALCLSHQLGGNHGFQLLMRDVVDIGFLKYLLEGIHDAYDAHQTSGPKKKQSRLTPFSLANYFTILSRIAVIDPQTFVAMIGALGRIEDVWGWLSVEWFLCFDSMAEPDRLKLNLLGITRLLELPQPMAGLVLGKLQDYLSMWTSVICEIWDDDISGHDSLYSTHKLPPTEWDTYKDIVERELYIRDPVRTIVSYSFVQEKLQGLEQMVSQQTFQEELANVDKEVLAGFQELKNRSSTSPPMSI
ncbi:putative importin-beta domain-containing protein [Rosellinia necatrix]|uniref:Putative importin-beta domain-containing protein n=1 Tax=Rosellinia necatrix TaxID=77044 RepID=A0A1S7UM20_ROSNE|nr:putative importin-beta domain-containing protein [Rosellinia necatrix]